MAKGKVTKRRIRPQLPLPIGNQDPAIKPFDYRRLLAGCEDIFLSISRVRAVSDRGNFTAGWHGKTLDTTALQTKCHGLKNKKSARH
ncbi:MAG: hypothetical protein WC829_16100 [Hyphomicrobium sp.]|jgi:hypothetical protein